MDHRGSTPTRRCLAVDRILVGGTREEVGTMFAENLHHRANGKMIAEHSVPESRHSLNQTYHRLEAHTDSFR
jgi:hypothetical protein